MTTTTLLLLLTTITTLAALAALPGAAAAQNDVPRFGVFEASLTQESHAANPYTQITATATFQRAGDPSERKIALFWDGGKVWRVRFSPDATGDWTWRVKASDPGLDNKTGAFHCVASPYKGSVMRRNAFHFQYQDQTPFYWLGDTAWALYTTIPAEKHDRMAALGYLDKRAGQGFTVIHSMLISEADQGNDGGMPFTNLADETINPAYWQEVDTRLRHLSEKGMIAGLVLAWTDKGKSAQSWQHFASDAARRRYARAIVARYSAFPVYFLVAGEWDSVKNNDEAARKLYDMLGAQMKTDDPHNRLIGIHPYNQPNFDRLKPFARSPWNDFADYQQTYGRLHEAALFCRDVGKPVVNSEYAYYRRMASDGSVNKANSATADVTRAATWDIVMAGGYVVTGWGSTYFGGNRTVGPFDPDAPQNKDWEEQIEHVRAFFTARPWWTLEPRDEAISAPFPRGADEKVAGDRSGRPPRVAYWALSGGGQSVAYVRGLGAATPATLALEGSDNNCRVRRFDPRTGKYAVLPDHAGGPLTLTPPDERDWVFEVTAK